MSADLSRHLDKGHLESIRSVRPDDLAPSLGTIIRAIVAQDTSKLADTAWLYYRPETFFDNTVLTGSFATIIKNVIEGLDSGSVSGIFLNLDMGSGKTHLLALLLHLFGSCRLNPHICSSYLDEYRKKTGYNDNIAQNTVVIAVDFRTPENIFEHLKLTERILSKIKEEKAGKATSIIRDSIKDRKLPSPKELADCIPENVHILVLIDELHYAVTMGSELERELAKQFIRFIIGVVNYRRETPRRRGGIVLVVASARRDFERWHEIESEIAARDRELVAVVNGFIDQLQRIEKIVTTHWLSLSEARKILEKRLRLGAPFNEVFHDSFNRLIERVIRADSDIPQAHHMRSLIKTMAIYALNALNSGDNIVSPAHFSEDVIDTLLGSEKVAESYKSIYSEIVSRLTSIEHGEWYRLAINIIFTHTITGDPRKLVEMVRVAKTREAPVESIPLVEEVELRDVLTKVHGLQEADAIDIIKDLDDVHPNIHRVRISSGGEAFFIAPVVSLVALYKRIIKDKHAWYTANSEKVLSYVSDYVHSLGKSSEFIEQVVVRSLKELEKKPHSRDKLYVYIYFNEKLLSQLTPSGETSQESFDEILKDVYSFYERRRDHNIVIAIPKIKKRVLDGLSKYLAIDEATEHVINRYIVALEGRPLPTSGEADEIQRELLKLEIKDLELEIGRRLNEAVSSFSSAMISLLDKAVYYTPNGLKTVDIKLDASITEGFEKQPAIYKVVDMLRSKRQRVLVEVAEKLAEWAASNGPIRFVTSSSDALPILFLNIKEDLQSRRSITLYLKEALTLPLRKDAWVYIPPKIVKATVDSLFEKIKKEFGEKFNVVKKIEDDNEVVFELEPKRLPPEEEIEIPPNQRGIVPPTKDIFEVVDEIAACGGGTLWLAIEIDRDSADTIKEYLSPIKKYVKDFKVEQKRGG